MYNRKKVKSDVRRLAEYRIQRYYCFDICLQLNRYNKIIY